MKSYQRILIFLLVVLFLTALLSPWVAVLWDLITQAQPEWHGYRYPFSRIFNRLYMILGVILFLAYHPLLGIESMNEMGLQQVQSSYPDFVKGFLLALVSWIILGIAMSWSDVFTPYFRLSLQAAVRRSVNAFLAAATVGLLEEIFFRGIIFKGLLKDWKFPGAFLVANLFFAAVHFVKPSGRFFLSGLEPAAGIRHVLDSFHLFLDPVGLFPGLFGLFLMGMVLSYAFLRTGSLYLSIGLHAGWIFGRKTLGLFGDYRREGLDWLFGGSDPKFVSGVSAWIVVLLVGLATHWITRNRQRRFEIKKRATHH